MSSEDWTLSMDDSVDMNLLTYDAHKELRRTGTIVKQPRMDELIVMNRDQALHVLISIGYRSTYGALKTMHITTNSAIPFLQRQYLAVATGLAEAVRLNLYC